MLSFGPSDDDQRGVFITAKTLTVIATLFTIFAATFGAISKVNSYDHRLEKIETANMMYDASSKTLAQKIDILNDKITDLTVELREIRTRQDYYSRGNDK